MWFKECGYTSQLNIERIDIMILVGIDIGKLNHTFSIISRDDGEILLEPTDFANNKTGFDFLYEKIKAYKKFDVLIGMEDTGHYHMALMKYLLAAGFTVALINPTVTDML